MKLKDKKIEILRQITTRDAQGFGTTNFLRNCVNIASFYRGITI